ncbi:MAG: GAF domain-containing protein [Polyangiaceae bacterium]|nr:GAF domain-containing protein [Polyangiaceae bacterium]MCW5791660.1 GAF domain-containing protein [Polyangiaceae bacterium]
MSDQQRTSDQQRGAAGDPERASADAGVAAPSSPSAARRANQSDSPPPDLKKQRDEFLQSFSRSARMTEQLVRDYEKLAERVVQLEAENASLRAKVEADDAIRDLLRKIDELEREKTELISRYTEAKRTYSGLSERVASFEEEFSNLANLFVASNQLHSSLSPRRVVRRIKEVLAQLVGAERYAVYLLNADGTALAPIASEGVPSESLSPLPTDLVDGTGRVAEVLRTGAAYVDEEVDTSQGSLQSPPAVIPLRLDDEAVGVICVFATLAQKTRFVTIDFELFKLLGQHAAGALICASLQAESGHRRPNLEAFIDLGT